MKKFGIDFGRYSEKELREIYNYIDEVINIRHNKRFRKMAEEFCAIAEKMRREFPWVDYTVECYCSECDQSETFNLFDLISKFKPEDFAF